MAHNNQRKLTRRAFLRLSAVAGAAFVLAGCGDTAAPPTPLAVPSEEQTEFDVILVAGGENKIKVIKAVREVTDLALKEAQSLVDSAPACVLQGVSWEQAVAAKAKLEEAGATVEVGSCTAPPPASVATPAEEQVEFDVILVAGGENKIKVIKVVWELTDLTLEEAKGLVDSSPARVLQGVSWEEAIFAKAVLEEAGATVEVK